MKRAPVGILLCLLSLVTGCQQPSAVSPATQIPAVSLRDDVQVQPIAEGLWMHTTYAEVPNEGRYAANGLIVIEGKDALLIDLPWTDEQTAVLFDWIEQTQGAAVRAVVPTHFHQDCMGGLAEAHRRGAVSYGLDKTVELARQNDLPVPKIPFRLRTPVRCGSSVVLVTYHGAGHTTDNVVAWLPRQRVLFGGCLIKALDAQSLGNTKDGDLAAYPVTLKKVQAEYRQAKIVVPGHGAWGGPELIEHTLKLCHGKTPQP